MDCRTAEDLMAGLIDDELSPGQNALLEDHLQRCSSCTSLLQSLAQQPLSPPPLRPMDADFWSKMDSALSAEMDAAEAERDIRPAASAARIWRPSVAVVFYAASLMLAIGWGLYSHQQLQVSQAESAMLRDALDREMRLSVQPVSIPTKGYHFATHTPSRGQL